MTYLVTFCTFDRTVEANPAWHGAFILSKLNEETKQVEVADTWGFYGVPSTGDQNHWLTRLKRSIGLDIDLFGNHGWLVHEEVRYMERGHGLHGFSYELTKEQFNQIQIECAKRINDQETAVKEALANVDLNDKATRKVRYYPGEEFSREIYMIEKNKAKIEGREPRLRAFDFTLSWVKWRPSLKGSHTCKTEALEILGLVLCFEQLAPYYAATFPRFVSGDMEKILLHSEGPLDVHTKSSGEKVYFRKRETPGVKLVWSIPPQKIELLPNSNAGICLAVDENYCDEAKAIVGKLQRLEWLFRNAIIPEHYENYQAELVDRIIACYQDFSVIEPETKTPITSSLVDRVLSFFSVPRNLEQKNLQIKIMRAKDLFNSLYMALVDGWEIDTILQPESEVINNSLLPSDNPLEALVTYLTEATQKKMCSIIGRTYCEPEFLSDKEIALN
ncbi:hypothetical protein [Legionella sp.]|uniref:hypothetical protein n=1 Tax=Legionella sp. TaxID=459 RepID=UPI003C9F62B6